VYDRFQAGDKVRFYLPNGPGPDGICTGTVVRVITRDQDLPHGRAPVGSVTKTFLEYMVAVDGGGRVMELSGAALSKLL
jgi:hypothetical protein